jgi:hypothetical protein
LRHFSAEVDVINWALRLIVLVPLVSLACGSTGGTSDTSTTTDMGQSDLGQPPDDTVTPEDIPSRIDGTVEDAALDVAVLDMPAPTDTTVDTSIPISTECAAVAPSDSLLNKLTVDGVQRRFMLSIPAAASGPRGKWPLIFQWHGFVGSSMGYSDTAEVKNWHLNMLGPAVDDSRMPFLLVTPLADGAALLDWNIMDTYADPPNPDVRLFDEVVACLDAKYGVDSDHIHSVGFSAGGILSDLLGVMRGDKLASTLTWSGGYLVNPANAIEEFPVIWPDPGASSGWTQVLFHGGVTDQWEVQGLFTAHFNVWNEADVGYLNGLGHDVILCTHTYGHTPPPGSNPAAYVIDFFKAHPRGTTTSPFASALPSSFPANCTYHAKTN